MLSLLLNGCKNVEKTQSVEKHKSISSKATIQTSQLTETEQKKASNTQTQSPHKAGVVNLADGSYLFCPEPPSKDNPAELNMDGFCFSFRKTNNNIIGSYFPGAPKGDRSACIVGSLKGNVVTGIAYELIMSGNKPSTNKEIERMPYDPMWNSGQRHEGNLKVNRPHLYATEKDSQNEYWQWIRYENAQLNLSKFYRHNLGRFTPPKKCPCICYIIQPTFE